MATLQSLIDSAAKKVGLYSLNTDEYDNAIIGINNMIGIWGIENLSPYLIRESKALTIGTAEYTVGTGGAFDTTRPISLESVFLRNSDGYDYPLSVINNVEYNNITLKTAEGRPTEVYFLAEYPLAKVIFNYEPDVAYTAYFDFKKGFAEYTAITETVTLPSEYKNALIYNYAIELAEENQITPNQSIVESARYFKLLISRLDAVNRPPKRVKFDFVGTHSLNIETDV